MKSVRKTLYYGRPVIVDCENNDSVDMRCGGPPTLGFDFTVDWDEKKSEVEKFIRGALHEAGLPCLGIYFGSKQEVPKSRLWSMAKIKKCIKAGY